MSGSAFQTKKDNVTVLVNAVRALNVVTAAIQMMAGAGSLMSILYLDVAASLVAVYAILFALLLLLFECRFRATDGFLRQYFGFLYTYRGLGGYLLIVGILDLGMAGGIFGLVAGTAACVNAMIVFFVGCCTPRFSSHDHTINTVYVPSYGSAAAAPAKSSGPPPHTAIPIATPVPSANTKKHNRKTGSALLNPTL